MKKLLLALFAMALLAAFTTPVDAAKKMKKPAMKKAKKKAPAGVSLKLKGFYRVRAFSANNLDQDEDNNDSTQGIDSLIRPNFLTTVGKGHIKARWEIDWWEASGTVADDKGAKSNRVANANAVWGQNGGGRVGVGTNRWHIDFAIPGSALRMRMGREDYTSPDREIFDSAGSNRKPGIGLYGKLSKNMSLSMFMVRAGTHIPDKTKNLVGGEDENKDSYFAALGIKVSPTVTLTPWVAMHRDGKGKSLTYAALHAKTKVGIFGLNASGVSVGGDAGPGVDASGWAFLLRSSASLGKMKLLANLTMFSGDDSDATEEGNFSKLMPNAGDIQGGILTTGRGNIMTVDANERVYGQKTRDGRYGQVNGVFAADVGVTYQVSKTLNLGAGIYVVQSAEADDEGDEDFGTELDVGMIWNIYPKLQLRAGFAYLAAGDYGANDKDDSWYTAVSLRHIF
ncbi:MAG: hypothetical protein OXG62_01775 [Nitrospinae bacterium]|nr:hypothetical protein [Nitrospinota bacterium]